MKNNRVSFSLTAQEVHDLEAIRLRYLFSDKFFPPIFDFKDIIQGMLYLTRVSVEKNRNSLRGFINIISQKRELRLVTVDELSDESEEESEFQKYETEDERHQADETPSDNARTRSYIFKLEKDDIANIKRIRYLISDSSRFNDEIFKDAEIIKGAVNYVRRHKWRNIEFFHYTYLGALYDLMPITMLKIVHSSDDVSFTDHEIDYISDIELDKKVIKRFIDKLEKTLPPRNVEELFQFVRTGLRSEFAGFNYAEAFLGYWLMSYMLPYNTTVFSFSVMMSAMSLLDKAEIEEATKSWNRAKERFEMMLNYNLDAVLRGNKEMRESEKE